ncbi:hypothetical protein FP507_06405 [Chlorobium phaeovibrioides]|uniref:BcpO-related WXXGXW repeat protein n=2 Tax=Chlorobium phaeovibrioides TaxID=1094 RepID=A0A5M8IEL0_CHLPH|nr:hypothetical protein [Chlorobium phaeovibrioides]KAA6232739.1 hypothetical protein FP507_06405 [Chlorobium phaeovibrioides]HCD37111.1 hypothetical protein [Chlorobium sp.]
MKKRATILAAAALFALSSYAPQANAEVNLNVNIGPQRPVLVQSSRRPAHFVIESQPRFLYTPDLGFYVSVGAPYDVIYYGNRYYIYNEGSWYRSKNHSGPWDRVKSRRVPTKITRHRYEDIRRFRDNEYRRAENYDRRSRSISNDRDRGDKRDKNDRDSRNDRRDRDDNRPRWR